MSYVIFGLNVPLLGMNRTCLVKITHVWNLPLNNTSSKWLDKSTHVWEKPLSICVLTKWKKPNTCVRLNLIPGNNLNQAVGGNLHLLVPLDFLRHRSLNTQGKIVTGLGSTRLYCFQPGVWTTKNSNVKKHLGAHDRVDQILRILRKSLPSPTI